MLVDLTMCGLDEQALIKIIIANNAICLMIHIHLIAR